MPNFTIGQLVKQDEKAEFRNDVQLSGYDDVARNKSLLDSYLFTSTAPAGYESAISILRKCIDSLLNERLENRFVVIANYGHGKSHLALAIANYFGRASGSKEVKVILEKINKALNNSSNVLRFREFKESRKEFLVIRLRGDEAGSLREQFLSNLEKALGEHSLSEKRLPGWYAKAEGYLVSLKGKDLKKADDFLEEFEMDVPLLVNEVKQKRDRAYDIFVKLYAFLDEHGFQPNLGGEVSLAQAIRWATKEFCGEGKPLGGIIILFDEFSLYLSKYAMRSAAGDLQDMLNGVSDGQGKVVFLAFAQQDPITIAQNALTGSGASQRESLIKELTRIPNKFVLYSLLESVIDSYLEQPETIWQRFSQDPVVSLPLSQATNIALDQFKNRYEGLGWASIQAFDQHVTKGCFPLHPITTALLCSMEFQQAVTTAGAPRTILGFILQELQELKELPAVVGKRINWVLPISLVDYFKDNLRSDRFYTFQLAVEHLIDDENNPFSVEDQKDVLKALLLQDVGKLRARSEDQIELIATMVGLPLSETEKCLRFLSKEKIISWNQDGRKSYSFWSSNVNPYKLDQIVDKKLPNVSLLWADFKKLSAETLKTTPVDVPWGHPQDWQAIEYVIDAQYFTVQNLQELIHAYRVDPRGGLQEGDRGCIIWLLAENEDQISTYRNRAQTVLDQAFSGKDPIPVILIIPSHANPEIFDALKQKKVLEGFSLTEKEEAGQDIYKARLAQELMNITSGIVSLRGGENYSIVTRWPTHYIVPTPYRAPIQQFGQANLQTILIELYKMAYRFSPPEFFTQYLAAGRGNANLRTAIKSVSADLLHNDSSSLSGTIRTNPIARDLAQKILNQKWKVITTDHRIKQPDQSRVAEAWNLLEDTFPANGRDELVKNALLALMNPPYGYDFNTGTLIFCLWFGYNSHDLQVNIKGKTVTSRELDTILEQGPKEFITALCIDSVTLGRRDATKVTKTVKDILQKISRGGFSKSEAEKAVGKLDDFIENDKNDPTLIGQARESCDNLRNGLGQATEYEREARKILEAVNKEENVRTLGGLLNGLSSLAEGTLVISEAPSVSKLRQSLQAWINTVVEQQCLFLEDVKDIKAVGLHKSKLDNLKAEVTRLNAPALSKRIEQAVNTLEEKAGFLSSLQEEAAIQAEIRGMRPIAPMIDLQAYQLQLKKYKNLSPDTESLREKQLKIIEAEISMLQDFVDHANGELDRLDTKQALDGWGRILFANLNRFANTSDLKKLQKVQDRFDLLSGFFDEVQIATTRHLHSLSDVTEAKSDLKNIFKKYAKALSDKQEKVIAKAAQLIDARVHEFELQALKMLEELETSFSKGVDPIKLHETLDHPIQFLPEKAIKRYETLVQRVDKQLDDDVVASIESRFRKIKDKKTRQNCIKRLQKIDDE